MRRMIVVVLGLALASTACSANPVAHGGSADSAAVVSSRTGVVAGTRPTAVVVAAGDIACPPWRATTRTQCRQWITSQEAARLDPDRVIVLGDNQYETGNLTAFRHSYAPSWGRLRGVTWPVVGNHEYGTPGARGYFGYFYGRTPPSPGYYRREINGWQVYLLNSNCGEISCSAERNWLYREMYRHPSRCSLIAMHHPRYSSGGEHGNQAVARQFWRVALRFHTDLALAGHDHDYERFAPLDNGSHLTSTGITSFVAGMGGRSHYPKGVTRHGSRHFDNHRFGVLRLALRPYGFSWQFRDSGNVLRDSGSASCH